MLRRKPVGLDSGLKIIWAGYFVFPASTNITARCYCEAVHPPNGVGASACGANHGVGEFAPQADAPTPSVSSCGAVDPAMSGYAVIVLIVHIESDETDLSPHAGDF
jgi:hypothetical protein